MCKKDLDYIDIGNRSSRRIEVEEQVINSHYISSLTCSYSLKFLYLPLYSMTLQLCIVIANDIGKLYSVLSPASTYPSTSSFSDFHLVALNLLSNLCFNSPWTISHPIIHKYVTI